MKSFKDYKPEENLEEKYEKVQRSAFGTKAAIKKKIFDLSLKALQTHIENGKKTGYGSEKSIQRNISRLQAIMTHESVEQIDEISTKVVSDYASKAAKDKSKDRTKGLALAYKKVQGRHANVPTTEEVEHLEEMRSEEHTSELQSH